MPYRKTNILETLDWSTIFIYLIMVIFGCFSIYGSSYDYDQKSMFDFSGRAGQQMIWIGTSFILAFIILMIESDWYDIFAYWIYALIIILLIVTIFIAPDIKGSRSWLVITPTVRLQPAEFAKFATLLAVAKLLNGYKFKFLSVKGFSKVLGLIFLPMILILMQKETGSALVYLSFCMLLYREGMSGTVILLGFAMVLYFVLGVKYDETVWGATHLGVLIVTILIILFTVGFANFYKKEKIDIRVIGIGVLSVLLLSFILSYFLEFDFSNVAISTVILICGYLLFLAQKYWYRNYLLISLFALFSLSFMFSVDYVFNDVLEPHQQQRIKVSLGIIDDLGGAGYNVNQSKIAIGSGGFLGKGFLNGTQTKLKYVPEQDTDFIFCTVGEEEGFLGTSVVLILFLGLILRLIYLAERQRETFNRVYGYGVAGIIFFHFAINIGMVIGITPVIGIPLPFFSYGGSSLWGFTILLFIFLRLDASRRERL